MKPWYYDMCQEGHIRAVAKEARNLFRIYRDNGASDWQARSDVRHEIIRQFGSGEEGWTEMGLERALRRSTNQGRTRERY